MSKDEWKTGQIFVAFSEYLKFINPFLWISHKKLKFIYSEKATKFCEISTEDLTGTTVDISQNFVAFSEYMNFTSPDIVPQIIGYKNL